MPRPIPPRRQKDTIRDDRIDLTVPAYHYQPPNGQQRAAARSDTPDAWLLADKWARAGAGELSQLAWWTLRNAARVFGDDPRELPATSAAARQWLVRRLPAAWAGRQTVNRAGGRPSAVPALISGRPGRGPGR